MPLLLLHNTLSLRLLKLNRYIISFEYSFKDGKSKMITMEQQRDESFWKECILQWYPNLHTQTYFFPPLHFNRVPYSEEKVADQTVYVPQTLDGSRQLKPSTQTVETRVNIVYYSSYNIRPMTFKRFSLPYMIGMHF